MLTITSDTGARQYLATHGPWVIMLPLSKINPIRHYIFPTTRYTEIFPLTFSHYFSKRWYGMRTFYFALVATETSAK